MKLADNFYNEYYRSINLLAMVSKLFENIVSDQITDYFRSPLSAYQKGCSCQHVILRLTEYWRQALDNGSTVGTVAMDLSMAFDKMPHALLIVKRLVQMICQKTPVIWWLATWEIEDIGSRLWVFVVIGQP